MQTKQKDSFGAAWEQANGLERVMMLVALALALWFIFGTLLALTGCAPLPVAVATETPSQMDGNFERTQYCTQEQAVVYEYPARQAAEVKSLEAGQVVSLTLYSTNGWLEVEYAGGHGFVERKSVGECR
jgi:hypothetical protein